MSQLSLPVSYVSLWCQFSVQRKTLVTVANKGTLHNAWQCHTQGTWDKRNHRNLLIAHKRKTAFSDIQGTASHFKQIHNPVPSSQHCIVCL